MAAKTPILCRVCGKKLGVVQDFQGHVFTLCVKCEKVLKAAKKGVRHENKKHSSG